MLKYIQIPFFVGVLLSLLSCSEEITAKNNTKEKTPHPLASEEKKTTENKQEKKIYNKLTPDEQKVILYKGTEKPFSGKYNDFFEKGDYHCKQCHARLYHSNDKFNSHCGWPSFDDEIQGAIKRETDADGRRIEILCANCDAHLGHVFKGEQLTPKNVRHCVNSISLTFVPYQEETPIQKESTTPAKAYFAGGCFWGVEYLFESKEGVLSAISGYMGGRVENPSYQEICEGNTGHLEAVEITYDPALVNYETLAKFFFEIHDPTQANGQGPDIGEQYLSAVFYATEEEKKSVEKLIEILKTKGFNVVTQVLPIAPFWKAEDYHQDYYDRKKKQPYCHAYKKKF